MHGVGSRDANVGVWRVGDIADGPATDRLACTPPRGQGTTHRKWFHQRPRLPRPAGKGRGSTRVRYDCEMTLSLCPLGRPAASYDAEGVRFPSAESSCEREKKSSSPSYGDGPEFI